MTLNTATTRAALVLQQVEERIARPMLGARERTALRCLRTAIEVLADSLEDESCAAALSIICDQWEAGR